MSKMNNSQVYKTKIKPTISNVYEQSEKYESYQHVNIVFNAKSQNPIKADDTDFRGVWNEWCKIVDKIDLNIESKAIITINLDSELLSHRYLDSINSLTYAIDVYRDETKDSKDSKAISTIAAKNFLYLIPTLNGYSNRVTIDSDSGFVNITFHSHKIDVFSVLITDRGEIHYSFVTRDHKLVKITGTAKIKDTRDLCHFRRVLRIL